MEKCKVIDLFEVSWGLVVILDFLKPTTLKLGDKLKSSNDYFWVITGIARSKFALSEKYEGVIDSIYVWDCTVKPIDHSERLLIGEELSFVK